jgi:class 3 adenylate cyclase
MAQRRAQRPDAADLERLRERLPQMGATPAEVEEAWRTGSLGPLALELALRGPGEVMTFQEAARRAGLEPQEAARAWRALGFPDPLESSLLVPARRVETLRLLSQLSRSLLGDEASLQLAHVIGSSTAHLAEAIVDAFRVQVEMPQRAQGRLHSEVVEDYVQIAAAAVPALNAAIGDVLAHHLVAVGRANWALDEARATVTRERVVGFADLVGYTETSRVLTPAELSQAIGRFEGRVGEIVARYGGRVVKLIGDEVMLVIGDPSQAGELALDLIKELARDPQFPEVRVGLAAGELVSHGGDYYGDVVNLAARLVKAAEPGTALLADSLAEATNLAQGGAPVEVSLKGYGGPVRAWRLDSG